VGGGNAAAVGRAPAARARIFRRRRKMRIAGRIAPRNYLCQHYYFKKRQKKQYNPENIAASTTPVPAVKHY